MQEFRWHSLHRYVILYTIIAFSVQCTCMAFSIQVCYSLCRYAILYKVLHTVMPFSMQVCYSLYRYGFLHTVMSFSIPVFWPVLRTGYCREGPFLSGSVFWRLLSRPCLQRLSPPREILHRKGTPFVHHLAYLSTWAATHFNSARLVQSPRRRRWRGWTNVPWNTCIPYFSIMWWAAFFDTQRSLIALQWILN